MKASLDDRISRAVELAQAFPAASQLLTFYQQLALFQKPIFAELRANDETDIRALLRHFPALLALVKRAGPEPLAEFGDQHLQETEARQETLLATWEDRASSEAGRFYGRVLLQPYAEHVALRGQIEFDANAATCPFCSARPVVGVLRGEGDGAKRSLVCCLCSTEWPFRRVVCPSCGQRDKDSLPVYTTPEFEHVRIEACDICQTYIKSVDLTRIGRAVPVVDEMATVALSIWADNQGYAKLETNLLGM